jgi:hypothetical protein
MKALEDIDKIHILLLVVANDQNPIWSKCSVALVQVCNLDSPSLVCQFGLRVVKVRIEKPIRGCPSRRLEPVKVYSPRKWLNDKALIKTDGIRLLYF